MKNHSKHGVSYLFMLPISYFGICCVVAIVNIVVLGGCTSPSDQLSEAIRRQDVSAVRQLLDKGVEIEPPTLPYQVNKPLAYAAAYGNVEIVQLLVEKGADLNGRVAYGDVPLIKASENDNIAVLEYLINAGADVNMPNYFGVSPFIGFCGKGDIFLVELAIDNGANLDAAFITKVGEHKAKMNFSPIQMAVTYGQIETVKLLMNNGADITAKDRKGRTLLEIAESKNHSKIIQLLNN